MRILHIPTATEYTWTEYCPISECGNLRVFIEIHSETAHLERCVFGGLSRLDRDTLDANSYFAWDYATTFVELPETSI